MTISGKRIGFFGGSFNPPTDAHKSLARLAISLLDLDQLHWIVSPHNPDKPHYTLAPFEHRKNMVDLVIRDDPKMICNDIEQRLGSSYTINTVRALRNIYPNDHLFFLMGGDNWHGFHTWDDESDRILDYVSLVVMQRPSQEDLNLAKASGIFRKHYVPSISQLQCKGTWTIIDNPLMDIAATVIREAIEDGRKPDHLDPLVYAYIIRHKLYRKNDD